MSIWLSKITPNAIAALRSCGLFSTKDDMKTELHNITNVHSERSTPPDAKHLLCVRACYNCQEPLELDFYWIVNRNGEQLLGVDVDITQEGDEWIEFEVCKNCQAAH